MSLLTSPRHRVSVQRRVESAGAHGVAFLHEGKPVSVPCTVRFLSSTEAYQSGLTLGASVRVIAVSWPGDALSLVTWRGVEWQQVGDAMLFDGSPRTAHAEVVLKRVERRGVGE